MTRAITQSEIDQLGRACKRLAARVNTSGSGIRQLLRDALDHGYPANASTVPTQPTNEVDENGDPVQPSTQPEAAVINPDRAAGDAATTIADIRHAINTIIALDRALEPWDPNRQIRFCPRCGHPLAPDETRCQQYIDGRQCGTRENPERYCKGWPNADACDYKGAPMPKGQPRRDGLCNACRLRKTRGNAIGTMADIHHQGDITGADQ